jgi:hypothetical protein
MSVQSCHPLRYGVDFNCAIEAIKINFLKVKVIPTKGGNEFGRQGVQALSDVNVTNARPAPHFAGS